MTQEIKIDLEKLFDGILPPERVGALKICVALSGGRDSVALAYALKRAGANLSAVNIEHGIRGENSVRDSEFVKKFCSVSGIELKAYCVDAPEYCRENGYTLEQGARILRYSIFDKLLEEGGCDYIALAHHADDQAETVLMRILRGTGLKGLSGMRAVNGRYIRPLLEYTREDIDAYVSEHGLEYAEDETNSDEKYTRNFLRQEIKIIKKRFPSFVKSIRRLSRNASEAEDFISKFVPEPEIAEGEAYIKIADLKEPAIAKRLIFRAAEAVGVVQDIEERHFPLTVALSECENGKTIELTHGLKVYKDGENLVFSACGAQIEKTRATDISLPFKEGEYPCFGLSIKRAEFFDKEAAKNGTLFIDGDKIPENAVLRFRKDGDFINKFGGGKKSLGDFLTDKKIPLRQRGRLCVLADGSRILVAAGVDISADAAVDENTKTIYVIEKSY